MGRTIALKLSEKERQVIEQINKQGITNSQLLRAALRQYFEAVNNSASHGHTVHTSLFQERHLSADVSEILDALRHEMRELREQMEKKQKYVENQLLIIQSQIALFSIRDSIIKQSIDAAKTECISDIEYEVDEFLKKQSKQVQW